MNDVTELLKRADAIVDALNAAIRHPEVALYFGRSGPIAVDIDGVTYTLTPTRRGPKVSDVVGYVELARVSGSPDPAA